MELEKLNSQFAHSKGKNAAHMSREDESKDDIFEKSAVLSMDAHYSGHCHVWNVAMLVSLDNMQGCWLVLAAINNYGAVVECHVSKLESCPAGQLAIHDGQGKQGLFSQVRVDLAYLVRDI